MEFQRRFVSNQIPEWKGKYLAYSTLVSSLRSQQRRGNADDQHQSFQYLLHQEVEKVEDFYLMKIREYTSRFRSLQRQVDIGDRWMGPDLDAGRRDFESAAITHKPQPPSNVILNHDDSIGHSSNDTSDTDHSINGTDTINRHRQHANNQWNNDVIRTAAHQNARALRLISTFGNANADALRSLVNIALELNLTRDASSMRTLLARKSFADPSTVIPVLDDLEIMYARLFHGGAIDEARKDLTIQPKPRRHPEMLLLGVLGGFSLPLMLLIVLVAATHFKQIPTQLLVAILPVFRLVWIPMLGLWLWGIDVLIWRKSRINHVLIFNFQPSSALQYHDVFTAAAMVMAIFMLGLFATYSYVVGISIIQGVDGLHIYPPVLIGVMFCIALFPFNFFWRSSRIVFGLAALNCMIAPFGRIGFLEFFVGDVLTSLVKTLFDLEYTLCYFFTGDFLDNDAYRCQKVNSIMLPIISVLPLFWRLMQCLRRYYTSREVVHLGNAGKYAAGLSVVFFSSLMGNFQVYSPNWPWTRILWLVCFIGTTLYNYTWDLLMDWGLGRIYSRNFMLRDELVWQDHRWFYFYCIISNFFFRFFWAVTITPVPIDLGMNSEMLNLLAASIEIVRRFTWAIIRVEYEHLNNCGRLRAVDFAPLPFEAQEMVTAIPITLPSSVPDLKQSFNSLNSI